MRGPLPVDMMPKSPTVAPPAVRITHNDASVHAPPGGWESARADHRYHASASAFVKPSRSSTVTVSAEWALRRSGDGTFSRKWMHTPAFAFVPNVSPSSFIEARAPAAVHQP